MKLSGSMAAGIFLLVTGVPGFGQLQTLTYRPVDAAYSTALDRLVLVNGGPNQLHLYDPATRNDVALALGYAPSSLALSADGRFAAVGHDQFVSWVDLTGLRVVRVIGIGIDVAELAVAR
ncbi:MAG: hypothetical protein H7Y20_10550, partial [Bryobacteraceae bacterium]|nr:hypothetical protein [Bryobacteraceae bacterium]